MTEPSLPLNFWDLLDLNPHIPSALQDIRQLDWNKEKTNPWTDVLLVGMGKCRKVLSGMPNHGQTGCFRICEAVPTSQHLGANKLSSEDGHICLLNYQICSASIPELSHLTDHLYQSWNRVRAEGYD